MTIINTAQVQPAETEPSLLLTARQIRDSVDDGKWTIGKLLIEWRLKYANGRPDSIFARATDLNVDSLRRYAQVVETFGDVAGDYLGLRWSHFRAALAWDDAAETLAWASENSATVAEMKAWRRMHCGEDLTASPQDDDGETADLDPQPVAVAAASPRSAPDVADLDPYQRPPSTVVTTPRDFPDPDPHDAESTPYVAHGKPGQKKHHEDVTPPDDVLAQCCNRIDSLVSAWAAQQPALELRRRMAAVLRRQADILERD